MENLNTQLKTYCELHWWNMGTKTLSFKGELKDLLIEEKISYSKRKTDREGLYLFTFKNDNGITFQKRSTIDEFSFLAKQFIQMELVRLGDKSQLYVQGVWRPKVTVNF